MTLWYPEYMAKVCSRSHAYPEYLERCPTCVARVSGPNAKPLVDNAPALVPGEPCYACGRKVPIPAKQRYAEWKTRQQ